MELLNSLIVILIIKILILQVHTWYFSETSLLHYFAQLKPVISETSNDSKCNEIGQKTVKYIPYIETYKYRREYASFYEIRTRINYRKQFQTWTCCEGYIQSGATCVPRCPRSCEKGTCKEPDVCTCNKGYRMSSDNSCVPECTNGCVNGTCVDPEICNCNEGYWMDSDGFTCRPVCDAECEQNHGYCSEPNVCTCPSGYSRVSGDSSSFICEPICNDECINGHCAAPNICMCTNGYEVDNHKSFVCNPKCNEPCVFGTCTAPETCTCDEGYKRNVTSTYICEPICESECVNGICTAPNRCACRHGFALRNDTLCEPVCDRGCQNGDCISPNHCVCHDGFISSDDHHSRPQCVPVCTRNCSGHGECVIDRDSDYECECHFGWTGWDCEQPTMCIVTMAYDHDDLNRITIRNDTNGTIIQAYENGPRCYRCNNSFDNETLCYAMQTGEGNMIIGCLLSIDLFCHASLSYDTSINAAIIIWPFAILVILLVLGFIAVAYFIRRKRQKEKLVTARTSTNIFVRESLVTDFLLPDI